MAKYIKTEDGYKRPTDIDGFPLQTHGITKGELLANFNFEGYYFEPWTVGIDENIFEGRNPLYFIIDGQGYVSLCNNGIYGDPEYIKFPFYVDEGSDGWGIRLPGDDLYQTHTVLIYEGIIQKLDEQYLPDDIVKISDIVQSDWLQNDYAHDGYIKNRTHYKTYVNSGNVLENYHFRLTGGTLTYFFDEKLVIALRHFLNECTFTFSDTSQTLTPRNFTFIENDEFCFDLNYGTYRYLSITCNCISNKVIIAIHRQCNNVKINYPEYNTVYHTLSEDYIPDTIARVSDIPDAVPVPATASIGQTICVSEVDENGKPTAWETADVPVSTQIQIVTWGADD